MKEGPILMTGESVRGILEGRKTKTRRVIKNQPLPWATEFEVQPDCRWIFGNKDMYSTRNLGKCPYGQPGDRLWVRETWRELIDLGAPGDSSSSNYCEYRADNKADFNPEVKWHPSIFMPRWASRITLEIVNVRVERVQAISRNDAKAEGVSNVWEWNETRYKNHPEHFARSVLNPYVANYSVLWDEINAKRGFGWDANPWVWVIEFGRVEG